MKRGILVLGLILFGCPEGGPEGGPEGTPKAAPPVPPKTAEAPAEPGLPDYYKEEMIRHAVNIFGTASATVTTKNERVEAARVKLGRTLFFDKRLSGNQDTSCNSCHSLKDYGIDARTREKGKRVHLSRGNAGRTMGRNSPSVFYAFFYNTFAWDGRARDLEEMTRLHILGPEFGVENPADVAKMLESIPGYAPMFKAAFPEDEKPITLHNATVAIGAFERKLVAPSPFDRLLDKDPKALTDEQFEGLALFLKHGCMACHTGPALGGKTLQKLGAIKRYNSKDLGRYWITRIPVERHFFRVPTLRNIEKTAPYLHDGSIKTLDAMVQVMIDHQIFGAPPTKEETKKILSFLGSLTGKIDPALVKAPKLPASGPNTPEPVKPKPIAVPKKKR